MNEKILVTGGGGLTGCRVVRELCERNAVTALYHSTRPAGVSGEWVHVDLCDRPALRSVLDSVAPDVIVHCAAHTDTTFCELHPQQAWDLNLGGTDNLLQWMRVHGGFLVHLSTDLVFDGAEGGYREDDAVGPISAYGRTKLEAERVVGRSGIEHCIARTSLIYGMSPGLNHSVNEKLEAAWKAGKSTPLFTDEFRCATPVGGLAAMLAEVIDRRVRGILHLAGAERVSRFELGQQIARVLGYPQDLLVARKIGDVVSVPPRAKDASLNISKARSLLKVPFCRLEDGLSQELKGFAL